MTNVFRALTIALFVLMSSTVAAAQIDGGLASEMAQSPGPYEVIVTFSNKGDTGSLQSRLGVNSITLSSLPMAAATLSDQQINVIAQWPTVESIYNNAPLEYSNYTSGEVTGGHLVHDAYGLRGFGSTIAVLDSGVDASHPDLALGTKTIQNVKIIGDLGLAGGVNVFVEGQVNTDTSSGHGTHVAGSAAGSGAASASDERRPYFHDGIAPDAEIVGLGAGEGLFILHALLGFDYAISNQDRYAINIITNSWGGGDGAAFDPNHPINKASFEAYRRGINVTFAASNSGPDNDTLNQYAIAPWVINVAAGTSDKQLADFSSRGIAGDFYKHPDVTAPGYLITSTRAPNTAIGALGPVVDPAHPEYTLYYHTISGTSMATPFVAGTVALLLEANRHLSPDQVEEIIRASAEPMPGYEFHEVGDGYIDVRAAIDLAQNTVGELDKFLTGDRTWSSQGPWAKVDNDDELMVYHGNWTARDDARANGGSYHELNANKGGSAAVRFVGTGIKVVYATTRQGGAADIFIDGIKRDRISFLNDQPQFGNVIAFTGLDAGDHVLEIRAVKDRIYFDEVLIDGKAYPLDGSFEEQTETYNGFMGPSADNLEIHSYPLEVSSNQTKVAARLEWDGVSDLDLYLRDSDDNVVASGATLSNPDSLEYTFDGPGSYTYEVTGYISAGTPYTLTSTTTLVVYE